MPNCPRRGGGIDGASRLKARSGGRLVLGEAPDPAKKGAVGIADRRLALAPFAIVRQQRLPVPAWRDGVDFFEFTEDRQMDSVPFWRRKSAEFVPRKAAISL